jgi:hypothetical protein
MDVLTILAKLFATYPKTPVTEETYMSYAELLEGIPVEALDALILCCRKKYRTLPSPAEILAEYDGVGEQKFLPAPPKTYRQLDEERQGRPVIERDESWKDRPNPFPTGYVIHRETREERLERLRITKEWDEKYAH